MNIMDHDRKYKKSDDFYRIVVYAFEREMDGMPDDKIQFH